MQKSLSRMITMLQNGLGFQTIGIIPQRPESCRGYRRLLPVPGHCAGKIGTSDDEKGLS